MECSVDGCDRPAKALRLCGRHYQRLKKWGDVNVVRHKWPERSVAERFWSHVDKSGDCWTWTASLKNGYGGFWPDSHRMVMAHRWAYEDEVGPVPEGLELDHLCRNRACVRPDHLEPVTRQENVIRGDVTRNTRVDRCCNGHDYTPDNTYMNPKGARVCLICRRASEARYRERTRRSAA